MKIIEYNAITNEMYEREQTDEEIKKEKEFEKQIKEMPKDNKELTEENARLKLQVDALNEQQEFLEDCLMEMAGVVYE